MTLHGKTQRQERFNKRDQIPSLFLPIFLEVLRNRGSEFDVSSVNSAKQFHDFSSSVEDFIRNGFQNRLQTVPFCPLSSILDL